MAVADPAPSTIFPCQAAAWPARRRREGYFKSNMFDGNACIL
jgi:hypothetical protein